jgi:hypothetical protein
MAIGNAIGKYARGVKRIHASEFGEYRQIPSGVEGLI